MSRHILLDSSPLGLLSNPANTADVIAITRWSVACIATGNHLYVPEVIDYEAGKRLLMKTDVPFPMTIGYEFADQDGGAVFRQRLQGGPGGVGALFSPLMAMVVRRSVRADMRRLRLLLEAGR